MVPADEYHNHVLLKRKLLPVPGNVHNLDNSLKRLPLMVPATQCLTDFFSKGKPLIQG